MEQQNKKPSTEDKLLEIEQLSKIDPVESELEIEQSSSSFVYNYQEDLLSNLPEEYQKILQQSQSNMNITSILDIHLSLENISTSLNVNKKVLEEVGTQKNLIEPLQAYKKNEKQFARGMREVVIDLDSIVGRAVNFHVRENKETIENFIGHLNNATTTLEQIGSNSNKIQKHIKVIQGATEDHIEYSGKIAKEMRTFFEDLQEMAIEMKQAAEGINTFKTNVDGLLNKQIQNLSENQGYVTQMKKQIDKGKENIISLENRISENEQNLLNLKNIIEIVHKNINTNNSFIKKADLDIEYKHQLIKMEESRKQEILSLKQSINEQKNKQKERKQEFDDNLFKKRLLVDGYNIKLSNIETSIRDKQKKINEKQNERDESNFISRVLFGKNIKAIAELENERSILTQEKEAEERSINRYKRFLDNTISVEIRALEDDIIQQNQRILLLESSQEEKENKIMSIQQNQTNTLENKADFQKIIKNNQMEIEWREKDVVNSKQTLDEKKKKLVSDSNELVKLLNQEEQFKQNLIECHKNISQIKRLDIPQDIIENFQIINNCMNKFLEEITINKQELKNTLNEVEEIIGKINKKSKLLSNSEEQEEFIENQRVLRENLENINKQMNKQVEQYKQTNEKIQKNYHQILNRSKDNQQKQISS